MTNIQRAAPVHSERIARLARLAIRHLGIRTPGTLAIAFISAQRMRTLNRRFRRHDRTTDVLSFRYDGVRPHGDPPTVQGEPLCLSALSFRGHDRQAGVPRRQVVGEIVIAPSLARAYATRHGIPYTEELARYVVHGLLHWLGHEDRTRAQQRTMRAMEDRVLAQCGTERTVSTR